MPMVAWKHEESDITLLTLHMHMSVLQTTATVNLSPLNQSSKFITK
jgi:hypothetical protein